ncbi:chemotaxis protein CheX [Bacteriovorax sp. Seq25_V]|uniref:chemotaxis protein CheX n=1 Tax=Bacteriovorax sp. Seq25_V TaxID=1201288 RepID=UPI00038A1CAB|nr:chemotaxis protein CheX [Bacteriovorax sp. Seq25_V]EQC46314.1 chemotaxis phosphatase CheX [Bacteriovorax sp. Seq25_V]
MKIVRKVLILSINTDWANELAELLKESPKIEVVCATSRTAATKLITDSHFEAVIIEESFKEKNIDYFFRVVVTQKVKPDNVFLCFSDFLSYRRIELPDSLDGIKIKIHSLPMPKVILKDLLYNELFPMGLSNLSIDREFNQVLVRASHRVLESLSITDIKTSKPVLLSKMEKFDIAIRGKVIIKTEFFSGALLISFPLESYKSLYKSVVGVEIEELSADNTDFAGEVANMIYGQAKKELDENGVKLNMAIPVLDVSKELLSKKPIYVIPVDSSVGRIYIKIAPDYF